MRNHGIYTFEEEISTSLVQYFSEQHGLQQQYDRNSQNANRVEVILQYDSNAIDCLIIKAMQSYQNIRFSEYPKEDRLMRKAVVAMMQSNSLKLEGGGYSYYKIDQLLEGEKEVHAETINLKRNYVPMVLKSLLLISFDNLATLNISLNHIESLQPIIHLTAPNLSSLDISYNRITSLRSLRKASFSLKSLFMQGNRILDLKYIEQLSFQRHIQSIYLQEAKIFPYDAQNLVNTMKINALKLQSITMKKRINHGTVTKSLYSRAPGIKINEPYIS